MSSQNSESSIKVILFSGKKNEYDAWKEKFLARAKRRGIKEYYFKDAKEIPKSSEKLSTGTDAGKIRLQQGNITAYEELILSINTETKEGRVAFRLVKGCKTKDYEDGLASMAWKRLEAKYASKTAPTLVKLMKQFANCRLKDKEHDPDEWITELEELQARIEEMSPIKTDEKKLELDLMIHVLNSLPEEYENQVEQLEDKLDKNTLDLEQIRDKLNLKFERMNQNEDDDDDEDAEDKALIMSQFKGRCHQCGKYGHKKANCNENPNKNKNDNENKGKGKKRFNGNCDFCGKPGHKKANCWLKQAADKANVTTEQDETWDVVLTVSETVANDVALLNKSEQDKFNKNTWVCDSGATCHMRNNDDGMFDVKNIDENIVVGSGKTVKATKIGKWRGVVMQKNGEKRNIVLEKVKVVPELWINLLSINHALANGWLIGNKEKMMYLQKKNFRLWFDCFFPTKSGFLSGITIAAAKEKNVGTTNDVRFKKGYKIAVETLHKIFHVGDDMLKKTAKCYDWNLHGIMKKCEDCAKAKARRKNIAKETETKSEKPGERLCIDISSVRSTSFSGSKFWLLAVDECTSMCWSFFLKKKSELSDKMITFIKMMRSKYPDFALIVRCDNAGENLKFKENAEKEGLNITFELTAPGTPQQNGKVERMFATLFGRVRSKLNSAHLNKKLREGLWTECAQTVTHEANLLTTHNEMPPYYKFYKQESPFARSVRQFGELAILTNVQKKIKGKLENRGTIHMFVGYSPDHPKDVYRFLNMETLKIKQSRDIHAWLDKTYGEYKGLTKKTTTVIEDPDDPLEFGRENDMEIQSDVKKDEKMPREAQRLATYYNKPEETTGPRILRSGRAIDIPGVKEDKAKEVADEFSNFMYGPSSVDVALIAGDTEEIPEEPKTFREAWDHSDPVQREKWRTAIRKEFHDMISRGVWRKIKRRDMPQDRRCVRHKWVFKIKRNGVYRARLVACGYSQIAGVDFDANFAPVINDVTWRLMLVAMLKNNWKGIIIDVETAFLHGDLEEDIYMDCPEGMEDAEPDECLQLKQTIYGLVQSARQFWKKLTKVLKEKMGFEGGYPDPCLLTRKNEKGTVLIALYVDDCLCIGDKEALKDLEKEFKDAGFTVKIEDDLTDYLSCQINRSKDGKTACLTQPHLIKNLEAKFGDMVKDMMNYRTPGTTSQGLIRPDDKKTTLSKEEHEMYRSGVGMLLFLVKHSRPDIANAVRELSKLNDCPTSAAFKELKRVIKYVLDTKHYGLRFCPIETEDDEWRIIAFSDSDYAGDKETRISVSGFVIFVCGVPICWRSKAQRGVTLSSSEAEYVALSETVKEVKFITMVLESMGIKWKQPIEVKVDNIGAIYMTENWTTSSRTKHVDTRLRFVNEYQNDGIIKVDFVKTKENQADIYTKNVQGEILDHHKGKILSVLE